MVIQTHARLVLIILLLLLLLLLLSERCVYCLVYLSFSLCYIDERDVLAQAADFSLSHSDWGDDFYTRARSRFIHRHMHRFDSMCTFDFNKSALELSFFFVVARGFVLSWVGGGL